MKSCILIPARFASSRFPGKPLALIKGQSLISRVAMIAKQVLDPSHVYVVSDSEAIISHCKELNIQAIMTSESHETGTDRIAEAANLLDYDYFINLQGDEPTVDPKDLIECISFGKKYPKHVINFYHPIIDDNPSSLSIPKVVFNESNDLLYISRELIPGSKEQTNENKIYNRQVCIYGFSKAHLKAFSEFKRKSNLEKIEDIEILRFFELSIPVKTFLSRSCGPAVDYPEDIEKVIDYLSVFRK